MGNGTSPLGMAVYERSGFGRLPLRVRLADRVELTLRKQGPMTLSQLHRALHSAADQERLHRASAELRERGVVTVRQERRHRAGRARTVVAPTAQR